MRTIRAFIAIPLPDEVVQRAQRLQRELADALPGVHWARPGSMHLTLRFFGHIDQETLDKMGEVVLSVGRRQPPFEMGVCGLGAFPSASRPRVVWLGIDGGEPLQALYALLEEELQKIGIAAEGRAFRPHLTLGRARRRLPPAQTVLEPYKDFFCGTLQVNRLVLFESRLQPDGALHLPVATAHLS